MVKGQKWSTEIEGQVHTVEFLPPKLFGKAKIVIDGTTYPLNSAKLFSSSSEVFMLGGLRAIISISDGQVCLSVDGDIIEPEK